LSLPAALPPELVAAFLQSHVTAQHKQDERSRVLQSSASLNSELAGEQPVFHNPFAAAAAAAASTEQHSCPQRQQQRQRSRQRPPLLRRVVRGLLVTAASAGLVALGAWGGTVAYR
jgi:hypothetical protein